MIGFFQLESKEFRNKTNCEPILKFETRWYPFIDDCFLCADRTSDSNTSNLSGRHLNYSLNPASQLPFCYLDVDQDAANLNSASACSRCTA